MNIREVAITTNMSEQAVRTAIKKGLLKTTKVPLNETQFQHNISEQAVTEWRANSGAHNLRKDGRRKMLLYTTSEELTKLRQLLIKADMKEVAELITIANKHNSNKEEAK